MGCGGSASRDPPLPDFPLKDEAVRVFKLADLNSDGKLDLDELKNTMKKPQFAETAMENLDLDGNGFICLTEWVESIKATYDKSEAAARTALKAHEKAIELAREERNAAS